MAGSAQGCWPMFDRVSCVPLWEGSAECRHTAPLMCCTARSKRDAHKAFCRLRLWLAFSFCIFVVLWVSIEMLWRDG
eukprot:scaffold80191_cov22-Tisochrysis_lutea.AAC.1